MKQENIAVKEVKKPSVSKRPLCKRPAACESCLRKIASFTAK